MSIVGEEFGKTFSEILLNRGQTVCPKWEAQKGPYELHTNFLVPIIEKKIFVFVKIYTYVYRSENNPIRALKAISTQNTELIATFETFYKLFFLIVWPVLNWS